ncbi:MAG: ABC transporter ATP-binding protein [Hyphomicrobiales bacterium]|nr:ABC transporter ATP-binding protein [Hyphomicrobiales bacterium]
MAREFDGEHGANEPQELATIAPALQVRGLSKTFDKRAVDSLDLTVAPGEFYALLGPNGAGKTTTLRMVAGLLPADEGSIEIFGVNAREDAIAAKRITAWLPDEPMLYDKLDPVEYLEFVAGLWDVPPAVAEERAVSLLRMLGLWEHRRERCEGFSRGMKQKVALAGALVHEPKLLMLDEPLTGLDAAVSRQVKDLLMARVRAGATIILTTHILEVAERLADRIGIIQHGRLIAEGTLEQLREQAFTGRLGAGPDGVETSGGAATLEDVFLDLTGQQGAQEEQAATERAA